MPFQRRGSTPAHLLLNLAQGRLAQQDNSGRQAGSLCTIGWAGSRARQDGGRGAPGQSARGTAAAAGRPPGTPGAPGPRSGPARGRARGPSRVLPGPACLQDVRSRGVCMRAQSAQCPERVCTHSGSAAPPCMQQGCTLNPACTGIAGAARPRSHTQRRKANHVFTPRHATPLAHSAGAPGARTTQSRSTVPTRPKM